MPSPPDAGDQVLVVLSDPALGAAASAAIEAVGASFVLDPKGEVRGDFDVVVTEASRVGRVMDAIRPTAPLATAIVGGEADELGPVLERDDVVAAVSWHSLASCLQPALKKALQYRAHRHASLHWEETRALLAATSSEEVPEEIARTALRLLEADAALVLVRGPAGRLEQGAVASRDIEPDDPTWFTRPRRRLRVPVDALRRRSERMVRENVAGPVTELLADGWAIGLVLAGAASGGKGSPPHGAVWALKSSDRRPFGDRGLAAMTAIGHTACLALDHLRVVNDLRHRLSALGQTRRQMEEDAQAAQVGRVAVTALRALQAPLAYMRTNLRFLASSDELAAGGNGARHLQYALDGLTRAEHLVEDAARVSQGRERVPMEVKQLIDAGLALARPLSVPEFVEVEQNAVILGHASKLAQAVAEVLRNASQAVGVTRIDVRGSRMGDQVLIEVVDDGEGIADDLLPRVRDPFFSTRGRPGLGLTSAGEAIEAGGGTLQIWSRTGVGTTVQILLPSQVSDDEEILAFGDEMSLPPDAIEE